MFWVRRWVRRKIRKEISNAETLSSHRKRREEAERLALARKSPPIAKGAKGGAPSSSFVEWHYERNPRGQPGMAVPHEE